MLHYFFALEIDGKPTKNLFDDLAISKNQKIINEHQGKYPVIFLTFKDIKNRTYESAMNSLRATIARLYNKYIYLLESKTLTDNLKQKFNDLLYEKSSLTTLRDSILDLSEYLYNHHKMAPIILIDEYDTPIQEAYLHGYYDDFMDFMRGFFGSGLKDNSYFTKAILTGITRVSKESLFSGVNNLELYTLLEDSYSKHFGFIETDINDLFKKTKIHYNIDTIKQWYNGYTCGDTVLYNPWSILKCIKAKGKIDAYWINTSGNELAKRLIMQSGVCYLWKDI